MTNKKSILNNKNIRINKKNNKTYISFIPYNREITLSYIKRWLNKIIKEYDDFILYAQGFNFNSLYETNKDLIKGGCIIQNNYTNKYITFKGVN